MDKAILASRAAQVAELHHEDCRQARASILQARALDQMGMLDSSLVLLLEVGRILAHADCDSLLLMRHFIQLGSTFIGLEEFARTDSVSRLALRAWNPAWTETELRLALLNNLAVSLASRDSLAQLAADSVMHQLLAGARASGDAYWIEQTLANLGSLKGAMGDLDSARYYLGEAADMAVASRNYDAYVYLMINLSNLALETGDPRTALSRLDEAYGLARRFSRPEALASIHEVRAEIYESMGDYKRAYLAQDTFLVLNRELLNESRVKAVAEMNERYESERKARQIQQLQLEKLDFSLKNERITSARNSYFYSGVFALLLAIGLYSRLRFVRKSREAIQHQKEVSDSLLLNILPASVAEELKARGSAVARHYDAATILFSDFEDFTSISSKLTPDELVEEVNSYFKAFDRIIAHYRLEKIKTIGDAYMAAAGIEGISPASAADAVSAGLAMQAYVKRRNERQLERGYPMFSMRLGIHSGPVVAGIVGASKFQYDLWGDTVNTASRMEGLGETGRVNISEATYRLVHDHPGFLFTPRGLMDVKGKGNMSVYFAELAFPNGEMDELVRGA